MKKVNILEVTLRDGSYEINFAFTSSDTSIICKQLEGAGLKYVEVGHGVGLNASNSGHGKAVQTDEEYMIAAKNSLKKAKYGMFCIPGIARLSDVDLAAKHDMGFIRIGTNITEIPSSKEFIKKSKDYGMFVAANFMKSYALSPKEFAKTVLLSESYGADMIYLVDSAGGMFPKDIEDYYYAIRDVSDITLGFHGHDNLGFAVANSLKAVEVGFEFIDTSLQGLGRSAGNACTESFVAALKKLNYPCDVNLLKVLSAGQQYVKPLVQQRGKRLLDIISGFSDFHSSYMPHIQKYSAKYSVDPALLIIEMTKIDKVNLDDAVLDKIAQKIKKNEQIYLGQFEFNTYVGGEQDQKPPSNK